MRNKDDSTSPTCIDPKVATFHDKSMRVCAEHLSTLQKIRVTKQWICHRRMWMPYSNRLWYQMERCYPIRNLELSLSSQRSKRHCVDNEDYVHEPQKTIEDMCLELENERAERYRIEAESQRLNEEQARLA